MNMTPHDTSPLLVQNTLGGRFFQYRAVVFLMLFAVVIWLNFTFIKPLLMGAIFAAVLHPLMKKFDKWKPTRNLSETLRATIVTIGFTLIVLVPIGLLLWVVAESALEKAQGFHGFNPNGGAISATSIIDTFGLRPIIDRISEYAPVNEAQLKQYAIKGATSVGAWVVGFLQGLFTSIPGIVFSNIVIIFTMFFMLIDGPKAVHFLRHNSIFNVEQTDKLIHATQLLCNSVIVATVISGAVQAAVVGLACLILGVQGAVLWAFITFIASFFPLLGTAPVLLFLAVQSFIAGDNTTGIIFLVLLPVVGTSDNIVRPYVLKGGAEMHPLIGFVAAFGALDIIGFYGLFIGPIVAGLFFVMIPMVAKSYPRTPRRL